MVELRPPRSPQSGRSLSDARRSLPPLACLNWGGSPRGGWRGETGGGARQGGGHGRVRVRGARALRGSGGNFPRRCGAERSPWQCDPLGSKARRCGPPGTAAGRHGRLRLQAETDARPRAAEETVFRLRGCPRAGRCGPLERSARRRDAPPAGPLSCGPAAAILRRIGGAAEAACA